MDSVGSYFGLVGAGGAAVMWLVTPFVIGNIYLSACKIVSVSGVSTDDWWAA